MSFCTRLGFGSEYHRKTENGETRVFSAFKIAQHEESYYDPDNGLERDIGGVDISDRLSYLRYGPEFWMRKRFGAITLGGRATGQLWNYSDIEIAPEYDHEYWSLGLNGQIPVHANLSASPHREVLHTQIWRSTRVRAGRDSAHWQRNYSLRLPRSRGRSTSTHHE